MLSKIVGIRMSEEDVILLKKVCGNRRENMSSFVRRAIATELARLSFLNTDEKKALGVVGNKQ